MFLYEHLFWREPTVFRHLSLAFPFHLDYIQCLMKKCLWAHLCILYSFYLGNHFCFTAVQKAPAICIISPPAASHGSLLRPNVPSKTQNYWDNNINVYILKEYNNLYFWLYIDIFLKSGLKPEMWSILYFIFYCENLSLNCKSCDFTD